MARQARELLVLNLLQDASAGWDDSNTFGLTPKITFGWFDESPEVPQVTISQAEESPFDGGNTGFSGMNPGTGDPTQKFSGTVSAHVWCRHGDLSNASTANPRQYNEAATEEIKRVINANEDHPEDPSTGNRPVGSLAYLGKAPAPEPDGVPAPTHHYVVTIGYTYGPD